MALLVCLLAVSGCTVSGNPDPPSGVGRTPSSATVSPDEKTKVASADGALRVTVPAGAVDGPGKLSVTSVEGPDGQSGWSIALDGAELVGKATLRFAMPDLEEGEPVPLVGFNEEASAPLTPVRAKVDGDELVVTTPHFSNWFTDRWADLRDRVMPDIQDRFDRLLSAAGEGKQPRCADEKGVRADGYTVTSDSGRRVYWCLGRENGAIVLKTVNARGYAVASEATPGLSDAAVDSPWAWLADRLTAPPYKRGNHVDPVPSGADATYIVDEAAVAGSRAAGVTLRADAGAYLVSTTAFAVDTMTMLLAKTGTGKTRGDIIAALKGASCLNAFVSMASTRLSSPADAQTFLSDALTMSFDCVEAVVRDFDFGWVLQSVVQPLMWLWSGALTAVNGVVAAVDTASETFGVVGYTITITGPAQADTVVTTIDPFTDTGLKPEWSLDTFQQDSEPLDCYGQYYGADSSSPYALGPGTHDCGGTADSAAACWSAQFDLGLLWCLDLFDPWSKALRVLPAINVVDDTVAPDEPKPMFLELDDGSVWWARTGGAWSGRTDGWNPVYGCANQVGLCRNGEYYILADPDGAPVVDDSDNTWTVTVGTTDISSGSDVPASPLKTRAVTEAWFMAGHRWNGD